MKRTIIISALLLSGCASSHHVNQTPAVIEPTPQKSDYQLTYGNDQKIQHAYEQYLKTGKAPNIITQGFEQFAFGATQPVINTSTFELSVISLEKGEMVTNVSSGDPTRWSYALAYSGEDKDKQAHIMIKPSQPSISTDLVITTDKRMYMLKLISTSNGKYLRNITFWYPEEIQKNLQDQSNFPNNDAQSALPNIRLNNLNFNYKVNSSFLSSPSWKPTRVFDDGEHTYIQLSDSVSSSDLPALYIEDNSGQQELVNYRFKKPYFIVDRIFNQAMLISGIGSNQSKVTIINRGAN